VIIVETWRQPIRVVVTQSLDVGITTIGVETVVAPTMDVVKRGILIKFAAKLGSGSSGMLT
jgi:hypothetical protein